MWHLALSQKFYRLLATNENNQVITLEGTLPAVYCRAWSAGPGRTSRCEHEANASALAAMALGGTDSARPARHPFSRSVPAPVIDGFRRDATPQRPAPLRPNPASEGEENSERRGEAREVRTASSVSAACCPPMSLEFRARVADPASLGQPVQSQAPWESSIESSRAESAASIDRCFALCSVLLAATGARGARCARCACVCARAVDLKPVRPETISRRAIHCESNLKALPAPARSRALRCCCSLAAGGRTAPPAGLEPADKGSAR